MEKGNLRRAMQVKNVSIDAVAAVLGVHRNTVSNKLEGNSSFYIEECYVLKKALFPEYDLEYLFGNTPGNTNDTSDQKGA